MRGLEWKGLRLDLERYATSRNTGASAYFAAALILGPIALALGGANEQLQDPRFTVAAVVSGSIALWSFQHALRHDPCSGASLCLLLGLLGSLLGWLWVSWLLLIGSLATTAVSGVYLLWRHHGREHAPDLLGDRESVYESGGIAVHWRVHEHTVQAGQVAWIVVELQNAWRSRARVEITLRRIGRRSALALPLRVLGTLESGEVGTLEIPIMSRLTRSGRAEVGIGIRARPHHRWHGRLRLRPKPPFPIGPAWLLHAMAIVTLQPGSYDSASLEFDVEATAGPCPPEPEAAEDPRWTRRWAPGDVATNDANPASNWVMVRSDQ